VVIRCLSDAQTGMQGRIQDEKKRENALQTKEKEREKKRYTLHQTSRHA
jgi:hypothetical protein